MGGIYIFPFQNATKLRILDLNNFQSCKDRVKINCAHDLFKIIFGLLLSNGSGGSFQKNSPIDNSMRGIINVWSSFLSGSKDVLRQRQNIVASLWRWYMHFVRTAGKRVDENPVVATDDFDEPLLAVPGASSHSTHRFECTQKIT